MRIGALNKRITIQRALQVQNDYGEPVETWVDLATVWAAKTDIRGTERYVARQTMASTDTRFKIRWRRDVQPRCRVLCEGLYYNISGVVELGRREAMEIYATREA